MRSALFSVLLIFALFPDANAGGCSFPLDPAFYEGNGYTIRKIEFRSPFNFFFLVRQRLNAIKNNLPIKEGQRFNKALYDESFSIVKDAVKSDSSLGEDSQFKIVVSIGGLDNCQEEDAASRTVDVVYRIFSTDPIPAAKATPEQRQAALNHPATTAAELTSIPNLKVIPHFAYDRTRRGFGGLDLSIRTPTALLDSLDLSASGSSSSREFYGGFRGSKSPGRGALDRLEYELAYAFNDTPASGVRLVKGLFHGRLSGYSKPVKASGANVLFRYGAAIEHGIQQTNLPGLSSRYGAVKLYGGLTSTTRYSETAVSYGLSAAGAGLSNLAYSRHIGDAAYSVRFPGCARNLPWDIALRATAGGIGGSGMVLVNDRFFGGNAVAPFLPGAAWNLPSGPMVRSIPNNRLAGAGLGGTSFYSANLTAGKVVKGWPLIPAELETPDFDDAIKSAQNFAENWFTVESESAAATKEYQKLLDDFPPRLLIEINNAKSVLASIPAAAQASDAKLKLLILDAAKAAGLSNILIKNAANTTKSFSGRVSSLRSGLVPNSNLKVLVEKLGELEPLAPNAAVELKRVKESVASDLASLEAELNKIQTGPEHAAEHAAAVKSAKQVMKRPREVIDTLRHESNRYAVSIVGIADAGRLWPDPYGTRYAIGAGGRVSLVTVNFTLGYAVNPSPRREIREGRGALFFSITYTNMFQ